MIIDIIAGARPNFVKISPIIRSIKSNKHLMKIAKIRLVHTGQHYDDLMSNVFFKELKISKPQINFKVGSGSYARQISNIMIKYEKLLKNKKSDFCLVVGDVNSTLACSLVAKKFQIPIAHVEGGIRSNDLSMSEEINRIVTDSISDYFFTTSKTANNNLIKLGVLKKNIFFVGNTMIDSLKYNIPNLKKPKIFKLLDLKKDEYYLMTVHRPDNSDDVNKLETIIGLINNLSNGRKIIFPAHPRTSKTLKKIKYKYKNIKIINPLSYLQFNYLLNYCKAVITDSGGITEESTFLRKPCITLRNNTERPETIKIGTNILVGNSEKKIKDAFNLLNKNKWKKGSIPIKWDGKTSQRIAKKIQQIILN